MTRLILRYTFAFPLTSRYSVIPVLCHFPFAASVFALLSGRVIQSFSKWKTSFLQYLQWCGFCHINFSSSVFVLLLTGALGAPPSGCLGAPPLGILPMLESPPLELVPSWVLRVMLVGIVVVIVPWSGVGWRKYMPCWPYMVLICVAI